MRLCWRKETHGLLEGIWTLKTNSLGVRAHLPLAPCLHLHLHLHCEPPFPTCKL